MRYGWPLLCLAVVGTVQAQAPRQPAPPLDPEHNRLDALLVNWERAMSSVQTIAAQCTRQSVDKTFQDVEIFEGVARYRKPNLALLEMRKKGKPDVFEKYICTGTFLYEYVPQNRQIRVHEMPPPRPGQVADDNFLSFLFGMKAEEARRRYELTLVKEDQYYYYIQILARFPADKADFQKARLVLNRQTYLPRQLWFEQPNGNEVLWDIPRIDSGIYLNMTEFTTPDVPRGWTMVRVPRRETMAQPGDGPPRVVRPNQ